MHCNDKHDHVHPFDTVYSVKPTQKVKQFKITLYMSVPWRRLIGVVKEPPDQLMGFCVVGKFGSYQFLHNVPQNR